MDTEKSKGITYILGDNKQLKIYNEEESYKLEMRTKSIVELEAVLYTEEKSENYEKCALIRDEIKTRLNK